MDRVIDLPTPQIDIYFTSDLQVQYVCICIDYPKTNYNRHLGIDCERTLYVYGIWKIKPDYETMTIFLQFSKDPIGFGQVVTKKYGYL